MSQGSFEDLTGIQFGKLTVLYRAPDYIQPSGQHKRMWHCKCECGNEKDVRAADLKTGNTRSCGCFQQSSRGKTNFEDLTGKEFGRLTVLFRIPDHITPSGQKQRMWRCKCECGNECDVYATQLKNGKKSCGCITNEVKKRKDTANELGTSKRTKNDEQKEKIAKRITMLETNSMAKKCPNLLSEWNYNHNVSLSPFEVTTGNGQKVWWKCSLGHEWQATINSRVRGSGCPYCSNKKILKGFNDLSTKKPELVKEWDYEKNDIPPTEVSTGSTRIVWWKCLLGHEWQATIGSRVSGNGCPYCSNQKILKGFNDLSTKNPELVTEWDYERNDVLPTQVGSGSLKSVWWKCPNGHSYEMKIHSRTGKQKSGCPYCSIPAKKVLVGFNDLMTKYPDLVKEWHPTKNGTLTPDNVLCGSTKKIWWLGSCGHEYEQGIVNRVAGGNCPYCSHQKLLAGFNDFASMHPELLNEWDYGKNTYAPSAILSHSHYKAWWKCPFGHSYQAWMDNRCGISHTGCPICNKENHTSFPEQALYYYVKKHFPEAVNSDKSTIGMELDIFIPSKRTAIEYDGRNWHKNNTYELKKNQACKEKGIRLIRIREKGLQLFDDCCCIVRENVKTNESLSAVIKQILLNLGCVSDVDVEKDSILIYNSYVMTRKLQSLQNCYPDLAKEWHPTKNGNLSAEMVAPMTSKKVWWFDKRGHEWQMSVSDRVGQKCGCPICAGKRIISGINDLLTQYPELCEEWNYEKNSEIGLFPNKVAPHSDKKAWWQCRVCGNEWQSVIDTRTRKRASGCPECGKRIRSEAKNKSVRCVETKAVYKSIQEAENLTGISRHCISLCCKGKQKTAGKKHWEFTDNFRE